MLEQMTSISDELIRLCNVACNFCLLALENRAGCDGANIVDDRQKAHI